MPESIVLLPYDSSRHLKISGVSQHQGSWAHRSLGLAEFMLEPAEGLAVRVHHRDGEHAGHLHPDLAESYFHLIVYFWQYEGRPVARGTIERWSGGVGGLLHLPSADALARWSQAEVAQRPSVNVSTVRVRLRSSGQMKVMMTRLARGRARTHSGHVRGETTPTGKYAGLPRLIFAINGIEVGAVLNPDLVTIPDWERLWSWDDPWPAEITIWRDPQSDAISASAEMLLPDQRFV